MENVQTTNSKLNKASRYFYFIETFFAFGGIFKI